MQWNTLEVEPITYKWILVIWQEGNGPASNVLKILKKNKDGSLIASLTGNNVAASFRIPKEDFSSTYWVYYPSELFETKQEKI